MNPVSSVSAPLLGGEKSGLAGPDHKELRKVAVDLEAAFLAEMLKSAGFGKSRDSFGGGAGEDQFGSLLVRAQAEKMAQAGGIGLAESLYQALLETNT